MKHGWEYKKLGDVCDLRRGLTYSKDDEAVISSKMVLRSNNIDLESMTLDLSEIKYLKDDFHIPPEKMLQGGSVFLCMSNGSKQHVGKVAYIEQDMDYAFGGFMGLIVPIKGVCPKYVYYVCRSSLWRGFMANIGKGIGITNLRFSELGDFSIPVPSLSIQQQIVSELDKLSLVIEKKKQQVKELDNLAQAIFYDMFGDPVENEKGWEVKKFGEVGELQRGSGLSKKDLIENGAPCILYGQIHTKFGPFTKTHIACIPQELVRTAKIAHSGDVIMAITSEDVEGSCKSVAWMGDYDIAVGSDAAIYRHTLNGIYVSYYTQTKAFFNEKAKYAKGFKVTHISTKEIATIPIPIPPLSLQQSFAQKVESIERQKELINQSIREAQTLFDSRMEYYFG